MSGSPAARPGQLVAALRGVRLRLLWAVTLSTLAAGSGIALLATSAWLLSRAAEQPPVLFLMVAIVAVRTFGLSRGLFRYLERLVGHDVAFRLQSWLRVEAYARLARGSWLGRGRADLLTRLVSDTSAVVDAVVRVLMPAVSAGLLIVATSVVLTVLSPGAGLLVAATAVLAGVVLPWFAARLSRRADAAAVPLRAELAARTAALDAAGVDLIAYGATAAQLAATGEVVEALRRAEQRAAWARGITGAGQQLCAGVATVGALLIGAGGVADGSLAPVLLAVLVLTPAALHEVLSTLPSVAQTATRTWHSLVRVREVLDLPITGASTDVPGPAGTGPAETGPAETRPAGTAATGRPESVDGPVPALQLDGLAVGWPGGPTLLGGLSVAVAAGEKVALVGPSGIGKTTVAATILGLVPPREGAVRTAGEVGYLAQDAHLFDTTVRENLRIGRPGASDDGLTAALTRVGLQLDLDRMVGQHGTRLSGGEARRLTLARLLLADDPVLVIDEPTEHLDRRTADALLDDLWQVSADRAVLVISHDPALIARCDRVVDLSDTLAARAEPVAARPLAVG